jgi:glycosyltransferase involved in cell wall biosynthesis
MRLGLIARADNSGLGMQTWEFYKHMKPSKTLVIDFSGHNGNRQYPERYPSYAQWCYGIPNVGTINEFLQDLDVVFVAEAPYNYYLYHHAKELGVKVAVQYNYEFFDWFKYPEYPTPDMLIAPSSWHYKEVDDWARQRGIQHVYLHCPVNRDKLKFRPIKQFKTFLHVAGRAAAHDRNGTLTVIKASKYLKSDAVIKVHFQGEQGIGHQVTHTFNDYYDVLNREGGQQIIMQQTEYDDYADVYKDGDVLLLPRRYGGNCLPLNEALSCGMPVIMPDISPNNDWLEKQWLVPAQVVDQFEPRTVIDIYDVHPRVLAEKIDQLAWMDESRALAHNSIADTLAERIDWQVMHKQYLQALEELCRQ